MIYSILLYTYHNHDEILIKLLTHRKDYMYDGSNKLHKQINSIKF